MPDSSANALLRGSLLVLAGRWLDLHYILGPVAMLEGPQCPPWRFAPLLALLRLFAWWAGRAFDSSGRVPVGGPFLGESLHLHT